MLMSEPVAIATTPEDELMPHGVDDFPQEEGSLIPEPEDEYENPPPIDYDDITGLDEDTIEDLERVIAELVTSGKKDRDGGGRDIAVTEYRNIFHTVPPAKTERWRNASRLTPPDVRSQIETVRAHEIEALFGEEPWLIVVPESPDDNEAAEKMQRFAMSQAKSSSFNLVGNMITALLTAHVDGMVVAESAWKKQKRTVKMRRTVNDALLVELDMNPVEHQLSEYVDLKTPQGTRRFKKGQKYIQSVEKTWANHYDLRFHNYDSFFMYPATSTIETATIVGVDFTCTMSDLEYGVKDEIYDVDAFNRLKGKGVSAVGYMDNNIIRDDQEYEQGVSRQGEKDLTRYGLVGMQTLVFHGRVSDVTDDVDWNREYDEDDLPADLLITREVSTGIILSCQKNPYHNNKRPFCDLSPDPAIGFAFYAYSLVGKVMELHKELCAVTRMGADAGALALSAIVEEDRAGRNTASDTQFKIGVTVRRIDRDGDIKKIHTFPNVPNSNFVEREKISRMIEQALGVSEILQGVTASASRPLGETNRALMSGAIRNKIQLICILHFLTWNWNQFFDYCRQFMEDSVKYVTVRDGKETYEEITLEELSIPCSVYAYCPALGPDPALRAQLAEKEFTVLTQSPFAQIDLARVWDILVDYCVTGLKIPRERVVQKIGPRDEAVMMQKGIADMQAQQQTNPVAIATTPEQGGQM